MAKDINPFVRGTAACGSASAIRVYTSASERRGWVDNKKLSFSERLGGFILTFSLQIIFFPLWFALAVFGGREQANRFMQDITDEVNRCDAKANRCDDDDKSFQQSPYYFKPIPAGAFYACMLMACMCWLLICMILFRNCMDMLRGNRTHLLFG